MKLEKEVMFYKKSKPVTLIKELKVAFTIYDKISSYSIGLARKLCERDKTSKVDS